MSAKPRRLGSSSVDDNLMHRARFWSLLGLAVLPAACLTPPTLRSSESRGSTSDRAPSKSDLTSVPYAWRNVAIIGGGFVSSIIFSREVEGLVYARTDVGGAYRLDPGNEIWQPLQDWVGRDK